MPRLLSFALVVAVFAGASTAAQAPRAPTNLDFETDAPGAAPTGWVVAPAGQANGSATLTADDRRDGRQAVVLTASGAAPLNLVQQVDATPYRGRRVRFRMAVRTDSPGARAHLWMRIDPAIPPKAATPPPPLFLDNMENRPIARTEWAEYDIVADVPAAADRIFFGMFVIGPGRAFADAASFEAIGKAETVKAEGPRPLTRRGLVNVTAFTRLLGYVRHFHPSDEAATADWDGFAVRGMRAVEGSANAEALARVLDQLFRPLAPTLEIALSGKLGPAPEATEGGGVQLLAWRHVGFGSGSTQPLYKSERVPATQTASVDVELGGGVAARVPLTVPTDGTATLPRATTAPAPVLPQPTRQRFSPNDRATRLAAVALAWNVLQHFYPYFDTVKTNWPAALQAALQEAATDRDDREFALTLRRMVAALRDGHAAVAPTLREAELQFMPPVALEWIEDKLTVVHAEPSTGLAAGDVIVALDGVPAPLAIDNVETFISGATPQWIRTRAVQQILAGARDSGVKLTVDRAATPGTSVDIELARTVAGYTPPPRLERVTEVEPGILYVDLVRISDAEFTAALPRLQAAKGIVFDLRGRPGALGPEALFSHLIAEPVVSPQWHVPEFTRPEREQVRFVRTGEWQIEPKAPLLTAKKVFLADAHAISYAESCLAIVERYKLGDIVGSPTAGTNGDANRFDVPGDYSIIFTGLKVLKHDGSTHHGVGIRPTIPATPTRLGIAAGRDEVLERGVQIAAAG